MEDRYKYALIAVAVIALLYFFSGGGTTTKATPTSSTDARVTQTWPPKRPLTTTPYFAAPIATTTPAYVSAAPIATATTEPPIVGVGAESPAYVSSVNTQSASEGIRDAAFEEVASTLLKANRVVDERIAPVISSKNGGILPNLDVRGDYDAMMCANEELADDCGCWNRSSAQRGIKLGYIKDTDRRRVVLAGP